MTKARHPAKQSTKATVHFADDVDTELGGAELYATEEFGGKNEAYDEEEEDTAGQIKVEEDTI